MHAEVLEFVGRLTSRRRGEPPFDPIRFVVEFGGRDVNGSVRGLFQGSRYVSVDLLPGPGVDVVADAADVSLEKDDAAPDVVLCLEVLEHAERAREIVANAARILGPDGIFVVTAATHGRPPHSAIDEAPIRPGEFYRNVDPIEMGSWLLAAGFARSRIEVAGADVRAVAWKDLGQPGPGDARYCELEICWEPAS